MPTLVVQLGHCYRKSGATGTGGEQEYAARVGAACVRLLDGRGGWRVRRILADDSSTAYRGDAFFAIHCDGSTSSTARGASVGYRTPEGQALGQAWKRAYQARGWPGFRPDNYTSALSGYYGTGEAVKVGNRRAVILECGFRTNPDDRALLDGPGGADRVALAIGDALGIPHNQDLEEDDVKPKICRWTGSDKIWAVTPMGHFQLKTWQAVNDYAFKWGLPRDAAGNAVVEVNDRVDWFGPNLTDLLEDAAMAAAAAVEPSTTQEN